MNENTFVGNFFFHLNIFLSHFFLFFLHFCFLSHFEIFRCIVKLLIVTFVEIQLNKENLKSVFGIQSLGTHTDILVSQMLWIHHWLYTPFYQNQSKKHYSNHIRQFCISNDWLILVEYWLNLTKVEHWVNQY